MSNGKPRILPPDLDVNVHHENLLAIVYLGNIQQADTNQDFIGPAAGVGPHTCAAAAPGIGLCDRHRSDQAKKNSNKNSRDG